MELRMPKITRVKARLTITADQKETMIRAMESDKELYKPNCNTSHGRLAYKIKWDRLTRSLNTILGGCKKNNGGWQKSWAAMKHTLKVNAAENGNRAYSKLDKRIALLMDLDISRKPGIKEMVNGCPSPTYSNNSEYNITKFDHPSTSIFSSTSAPPDNCDYDDPESNEQYDDCEERIELQPVDDNVEDDITMNHHEQTVDNFKTDEAIDLIANLLERQTAAIERQTEAIIKKPTPPAPNFNINAAVNVIGQILERQTKAIERQTLVLEKQNNPTLAREKSHLDGDEMKVIMALLERQTKATEKLTASVEEQVETIQQFHVMMNNLLRTLSVVVHNT